MVAVRMWGRVPEQSYLPELAATSADVRTYAEGPAGRPFLLWGSAGRLEIALDRGSAGALLGLAAGDEVGFAGRGRA